MKSLALSTWASGWWDQKANSVKGSLGFQSKQSDWTCAVVTTCSIRLCPSGCSGASVLSCTVSFIIEEGVREREREMTLLLCFMSAEAQREPDPPPAFRPWQRVIAVFKARLVKYWTQQCADKGTSLQWEQWQGQSCVSWYPGYLFLGLGKCLNGTVCAVSCLCNTYTVSLALW